jgi:hypothetical protein
MRLCDRGRGALTGWHLRQVCRTCYLKASMSWTSGYGRS